MDEDDSKIDAFPGQAELASAYDFNKHLATLSLISIGGVLGLLQNENVLIGERPMMMSVGSLGASALVALLMNASIVGAPLKGTPKPVKTSHVFYGQWLSVCLLIFGAGIFTGAFSTNL